MEKILYRLAYCRLFAIVALLAASEWIWLGWYMITDFKTSSTISRIRSNTYCPQTVLSLYIHFRLGNS